MREVIFFLMCNEKYFVIVLVHSLAPFRADSLLKNMMAY